MHGGVTRTSVLLLSHVFFSNMVCGGNLRQDLARQPHGSLQNTHVRETKKGMAAGANVTGCLSGFHTKVERPIDHNMFGPLVVSFISDGEIGVCVVYHHTFHAARPPRSYLNKDRLFCSQDTFVCVSCSLSFKIAMVNFFVPLTPPMP